MATRHQGMCTPGRVSRASRIGRVLLGAVVVASANSSACRRPDKVETTEKTPGVLERVVEFRAQVVNTQLLNKFEGTVPAVEGWDRFVVSVRLAEDVDALPGKQGDIQHFAVHSVEQLFQGEDVLGQIHRFRVEREIEGGKVVSQTLCIHTRTGQWWSG
jgi:hypothetical protein